MKLLFDFFPILLFFVAYKVFNIYVATLVAMLAALLQTGGFWVKNRRFEAMHLISLAIILLLGGATLLFHDVMFIKWKPTAIYWIFAVMFLGTHVIGRKTLVQRIMGNKIVLPPEIWRRLNLSWGLFFGIMGFLNLYVVYHYNTNTWVNFKLFGTLGLTVIFVILQSFYMAKFLKEG